MRSNAAGAVFAFDRMIALNPDDPEVYLRLGQALAASGAPTGKVAIPYQAIADRFPKLHKYHPPIVQYFHDVGDQVACERYAKRMIEAQIEQAESDPMGRLGFRLLSSGAFVSRIGEIASQLGIHAMSKILGWRKPTIDLLPVAPGEVGNEAFLDYFREHVTIVSEPDLVAALRPLYDRIGYHTTYVKVPDGRVLSKNRAVHYCMAQWEREGRAPLLRLRAEHVERGREALSGLGMPRDAWFACLHVREAGYMREAPGSSEEFRNSDVFTFLPAVQEIVKRGGWVVRIGDPSMKPLPAMANVIDYVHSSAKSQWMDVFLAGACRFVLGSGSGMSMVAQLFGRPIADCNWYPSGNHMWTSREIYLVKRYWSDLERRFLTWPEVMTPPLALNYDSRRLTELGLRVVDNSAEEIRELCVEMLDRLEGKAYTPADDLVQERWHALKAGYWREPWLARIGRGYLERYPELMPD
jgi:putative glycosyltransferase (TIGR04372 family)